MLLHEVLDPLFLQVLAHVLLHVEDDAGPAAQPRVLGFGHGEATPSLGRPKVAIVVVVFRDNLNLVCHEIRRVEPHAELTDHGDVGPSREGLHEGLGAGLGDGPEVVYEVGLGHADAGVLDGEGVVGLVGDELDLEFRLAVEDRRVSEGLVADLVERIGGVGDELAEKDFLVRVEGVNDQREELVDVGREGVAFGFSTHGDGRLEILDRGIERN
mmetsp:Transcript_6009/g.13233  ORF Transcript_6009/g.13233 Transcript_6009/m.13233 type:complete len:214 (-) Transcript_6009:17-658(-)